MLLDSFEFCPTLVDILKSRRVVGRSGKVFEALGALSSLNNLFVLQKLMREKKPRRTLEIGMCFGGSGLLLTACHRELDRLPQVSIQLLIHFRTTFGMTRVYSRLRGLGFYRSLTLGPKNRRWNYPGFWPQEKRLTLCI